tara:strand:+ start:1273 stop:1779 length:507 start_codon:yes stop_codon:yes gene_type:complete
MGQEFTINSPTIESTINDLLPSQGGYGAGIDFSASTMIIPIIDVTPAADGSGVLREDLQRSFGFTDTTAFSVGPSATTTIISTTGYWRIHYTCVINANANAVIRINDATTTKSLVTFGGFVSSAVYEDEIEVFLSAGKFISIYTEANTRIQGAFKQIADISGTLSTPS